VALRNARFADDREPIDADCTCPTCRRYSRAYLRHLFKAREILGPVLATQHNLFFLRSLVDDIREAIRGDRFTEFSRTFLRRYEQHAAV
jgi:queuine tRNA-ribosyltransferase